MRCFVSMEVALLAALPGLAGTVLENGGFEVCEKNTCKGWSVYHGGYAVDRDVRHGGAASVRCDVAKPEGGGVSQVIVYDKPDKTPIVFGGWSKAENAIASQYCVYLDIWYENGGNAWAETAEWRNATHDWEYTAACFYPEKPVKKIQFFAFLRQGTGRVWFDDLFLERRQPSLEVAKIEQRTNRPFSQGKRVTLTFLKPLSWSIAVPAKGTGKAQTFSGKGTSALAFIDDSVTAVTVSMSDSSAHAQKEIALPPYPSNPFKAVSAVWTADSMRRVTPLTFPTAAELAAPKAISLDLARREHESAQILVSTADDEEWTEGSLSLPELKKEDGKPLDGKVTWERVGYFARGSGYYPHPLGEREEETWLPDPLLPAAPFKVFKGATQGLWLTVYAAPDAAPGVYSGDVVVSERGKPREKVRLSVRVRNFSLPETFGMPTAFCVMDGFTRACYPKNFQERKRQSHEIMLDYRLNPDDISRTEPPAIDDLLFARSRGMNRFNILNLVPKPKDSNTLWVCYVEPDKVFNATFYDDFKARLTPYVAELRKHDLVKYAYIYGFDERTSEYYVGMDNLWKNLKRDFPDIPVMTTAMMYSDMVRGNTNLPCLMTTDWYCPLTPSYRPELSQRLRAAGKQVWWYTCCGPLYPFANMASLEFPFIEGRLLGWMTHLYRADGLLYWHVNYWSGKPLLDERNCYFPEWHTANSLHMPSDGIFLYPGKNGILPSIRLANVRDGVEDYEWLQLAAAKKGADAADAASHELITNMKQFSRSPEELRRVRARLADLIEGK